MRSCTSKNPSTATINTGNTMNTRCGQVMGTRILGGVSAFFVTWDHRPATRAILIETIYGHAGSGLGTRALVDAGLDYCIGREHSADNYDREDDPHRVFPTFSRRLS